VSWAIAGTANPRASAAVVSSDFICSIAVEGPKPRPPSSTATGVDPEHGHVILDLMLEDQPHVAIARLFTKQPATAGGNVAHAGEWLMHWFRFDTSACQPPWPHRN